MSTKLFAAALIGTMMATSAMAQSPSAMTTTTTTTATNSSYQGNWRTSKVVGLNVYNDQNESLGSINDLLTDKQGKVVAVIVGVGGFLGVGERNVAIPFEKVKFSNDPVANSAMTTSTTRPAGTTTGATGGTVGAATTTSNGMTATAPAATTTPNPWYPDHAVVSATKDELKALPEFKFST